MCECMKTGNKHYHKAKTKITVFASFFSNIELHNVLFQNTNTDLLLFAILKQYNAIGLKLVIFSVLSKVQDLQKLSLANLQSCSPDC